MPDFYGELMTEWRWIIYPWSVYEDMMELVEKLMEKRTSKGEGKGKMGLEEIRSAMKDEYDLYIPYHLLREVLANMESQGKLRSVEQEGKVFWVMQ